MAKTFTYKMKSISGQTIGGSIIAEDEQAVVAHIREKGNFAIAIKEEKPPVFDNILSSFQKVSAKDIAVLCRQFSAMTDAGISLTVSLEILIEQTKNSKLKPVLEDIYFGVQKGDSLSKTMMRHAGIFPAFMISMIASAEAGGALDIVMKHLAAHFEKEHKFKEKVNTALAYPITVIAFSFMSLSFIMTFILPSFVNLFETMNVDLPLPTLILLEISNFLKEYGWHLLTAIIPLAYLGKIISRQPKLERMKEYFLFHLPVFGQLQQKKAIARFSRTLAMLEKSGVPLIESIEIVKKIFGRYLLTEALTNARTNIITGKGLAVSLKQSRFFPPMATQMIAVGEESGTLSEMLEKIADFYDGEVDEMLARLGSLLEPMLIGVLGLVIGLIILAVMLPVFEMTGLIN